MHKQFFRCITWVLIAAGVAIGAYIAFRRPGSSRWIAEITFACCNTPCGEAASRGGVDVRQTSIPRQEHARRIPSARRRRCRRHLSPQPVVLCAVVV